MIYVVKRGGSKEPLDISKFQKVTRFACEGLAGVSPSELELKTQLSFFNNIKSSEIQETLIKAAADLIDEKRPNYQYVAGRLINYHLRKEVYGSYTPPHLKDHYDKVAEAGYYTKELGEKYSDAEWEILNSYINHERDIILTYAAMEQFRGKYLIKNRVTGEFFETPQMAFMLIAMTMFMAYTENRIRWVKDFYDALSTFDISLPTPIMAGMRSPDKQFSSCVVIETGDSLDSINATTSAIVKYVSQKAGIGIGGGRIRAINSPIRNGSAVHTGVVPFYKMFQAAIKSCSQGGVRGGAGTLYYPLWHLEIEDMLQFKSTRRTEDLQILHLDFGVQFNMVMYERLLADGDITLFSPHDVPDLYDAFFEDTDKFRELYEKYESSRKIRKKTVRAADLFDTFVRERKSTGRLYLMNVDHCNSHGSFVPELAPIRMSNLCTEITLPTVPLDNIFDENGRISLCTLAAINMGKIQSPQDFERPARLLVRALDELLDYQMYPVKAAENSTMDYRPLGIGLINYAYWLAKNGTSYQDPDLDLVHEYAEAYSFYLIKASMELAKEKGMLGKPEHVRYTQGILPIDTYKKDVDDLVKPVYKCDWEWLREQLKKYGIRNGTLMAIMPSETSAQISNSTNGIEPPRSLVSIKQSKDGLLRQVVPSIHTLKNKYDLLWDQTSPEGYLKICAVLQKFIDQAMSVNTSYNAAHSPDGELSMTELLSHILMHYKYGGKTLYYFNELDGATDDMITPAEAEAKPNVNLEDQEDCDGCVL